MIVIDDLDRAGPTLTSYERMLVVQRLISSAQRLDLPLLATAQSGRRGPCRTPTASRT